MTRLPRIAVVVIIAALTGTAISAQQKASAAAVMLEAGRQKETLQGDLPGAIAIYKDLVTRYSKTDRAVSATALLRMAGCYEKIGDPKAADVYQDIVTNYADQATAAAAARSRLSSGMPTLVCELCADVYGSVSPDGKFMATVSPFFGGENVGDIGLLELATNKLTPLHIEGSGKEPTGIAFSPVLSSDMRQIAYLWASNKEKSMQLRVVPREPGGKARVLVNNPEIIYIEPHGWASNGSVLVMMQRPDRTWEIGLVAASTGAMTKIRSLDWRISNPNHESSLSPDGRFIAYAAMTTNPKAAVDIRQGNDLERQIYVVGADGKSETVITNGAGVKRYPVWTPDGSHVLYVSNVGGPWALWAIPMRAGKPTAAPILVKNEIAPPPLGMSTAGGYHFYQGRSGVIRTAIVPADVVQSAEVRRDDTFVGERPSWSPDGKSVAVARSDAAGAVEIVVRTLATGEERTFKHPAIDGFPFNWYGDSRSVLFQAADADKVPSFFRADLETGGIQKIGPVGAQGFRAHGNVRALSPEGKTLYLGTSRGDSEQVFSRVTALDLSTGARREVFQFPIDGESLPRVAQDIAIAASPDGRQLALFFRDRTIEKVRLAVVGVDGTGYRELTSPVNARSIRTKLAWSRDGQWIYFTTVASVDGVSNTDSDLHRIMRIRATGGTPEPTSFAIDGLERFDVSPDGSKLAYSTLRPEGWGELLWNLDISWLMKKGK